MKIIKVGDLVFGGRITCEVVYVDDLGTTCETIIWDKDDPETAITWWQNARRTAAQSGGNMVSATESRMVRRMDHLTDHLTDHVHKVHRGVG